MTYEQTLDWMFGQLPMYQQKGKAAYTSKLDNILALSSYLGDPHKKFKSIHIAGTNGKGSCSHMLASILQEAGYNVGLYTSPHLKDFRERIKINGQMAPKSFVIDFIQEHKSFLMEHKLSFFEMTVGMAFDFFARKRVDIAIIEVGLGGRLDSTNIIIPEVSLITNIGWDHTDILGRTLALITREKAGIIKPGVPVVIGEYQDETAEIFEAIAQENGSEIVFADRVISRTYKTDLLGAYQLKNIKGVLACLTLLTAITVTSDHIENGLLGVVKNTGLKGRWQILPGLPKVICDTAHNKEGLALVLEQLFKEDYDQLHFVLGFVHDKNLEMILPLFPKNAHYYWVRPDIRRGLNVEDLEIAASKNGLRGTSCPSVSQGLEQARTSASKTDLIYVGGSTFTVAEVL